MKISIDLNWPWFYDLKCVDRAVKSWKQTNKHTNEDSKLYFSLTNVDCPGKCPILSIMFIICLKVSNIKNPYWNEEGKNFNDKKTTICQCRLYPAHIYCCLEIQGFKKKF